jgi:hypothetical protein
MNRVYGFVANKARGLLAFSPAELGLIAAAALLVWAAVNPLAGLGAGALGAVGLIVLRRTDNDRPDHIELRLRHFTKRRATRLGDPDPRWRRFEPAQASNRKEG